MVLEQTPTIPDPSTLAALDPAVAITFLVVAVILTALFFFGPGLREKLSRKPPDPPPPPPPPATSSPPVAAAAVDSYTSMADRHIAYLEQQVAELKSRVDQQDRVIAQLRDDLERARLQSFYTPGRRRDGT